MHQTPSWLHLVAVAHADDIVAWAKDDVVIQRVTGGHNNALYRIEAGGACYACKLCVHDERQRATREYDALQLLHLAGLDIAPEPLWLDKSCTILPFPAVVYRWLSGVSLRPPLTQDQLAALLDSFQRTHALRTGQWRSDLTDSWFHKYDFDWYLAELNEFLAQYGPWLATIGPDGAELRDRLARLLDRCTRVVAACDVNPGREHVAVCLCRADVNLANTVLGQDGRLRWVDWEYSGWGDPALDLSELRWHATLAGLGEAQHRWLREEYRRPADDADFAPRLRVWDHIIVTRWAFLLLRGLWSRHNGSDRVRLTQIPTDPTELHTRLVRFIERAEGHRYPGNQHGYL